MSKTKKIILSAMLVSILIIFQGFTLCAAILGAIYGISLYFIEKFSRLFVNKYLLDK